jgi:hypothetical protein
LSNRGAYYDLEYLVFAQARLSGPIEVLVDDFPSIPGYLFGQRMQWLGEASVIERGPTIGWRSFPLSFADSLQKRPSCLFDI